MPAAGCPGPLVPGLVWGDTLRLDHLPHRPQTPAVLAPEARRPSCHCPPGPFLAIAALFFLTASLRRNSQLTQFTTDPVQVKALGSSEFSNLQHSQFWNIFLPPQRNPATLIITPQPLTSHRWVVTNLSISGCAYVDTADINRVRKIPR